MAVHTDQWLALLAQSRLFKPEELAAVRQAAHKGAEPAALAEKLVKHQKLTQWQAEQLLSGHASFFLGKYKLLDKLGEGGMGAVYKAEQANLRRVVALKVMAKKVLADPAAVSRFHREIRSVSALQHPNIIAAYDADQVGDTHFLVMEFVAGRDLKEWIKEHGRLPLDWSCECMRQAALGLQHAHQRKVIHRDIKPSNLLVAGDDPAAMPKIKILDMGLARFTSETQHTMLTHTGQVLGTIDYISPEQARDTKSVDIRADIFSLGCSLYHLLTGEVPFPGRNPMEKLMARAMRDAPPAQKLRPDLPDELNAIIAKMLARKPAERQSTPGEVADALAPFADGTASEPRSLTVPAQETRCDLSAGADASLTDFSEALSSEVDPAGYAPGELNEPATDVPGPFAVATGFQPVKVSAGRSTKGRNPLVIAGIAAAALLLLIGLVVIARPARQAVLTLDLNAAGNAPLSPKPSRKDLKLEIDGKSFTLPTTGPLEFPVPSGKHRVKISAAGFDPSFQELTLSVGERRALSPEWKPNARPAPVKGSVPTSPVGAPPVATTLEQDIEHLRTERLWGRFPVGAWVSVTQIIRSGDKRDSFPMKQTLVDNTGNNGNKWVVNTEQTQAGKNSSFKQTLFARNIIDQSLDSFKKQNPKILEIKEEILSLAGHTLPTKMVRMELTDNKKLVTLTVWTSEAVPGGICRAIRTQEQEEYEFLLRDYSPLREGAKKPPASDTAAILNEWRAERAWGRFAAGSWVKFSTRVGDSQGTLKQTLVEVSGQRENMVLESEVLIQGKTEKFHQTMTRNGFLDTDIENFKKLNPKFTVLAEEKIMVAGRQTTANVFEVMTGDQPLFKIWLSEGIPGGVCKWSAATTSREVLDFHAIPAEPITPPASGGVDDPVAILNDWRAERVWGRFAAGSWIKISIGGAESKQTLVEVSEARDALVLESEVLLQGAIQKIQRTVAGDSILDMDTEQFNKLNCKVTVLAAEKAVIAGRPTTAQVFQLTLGTQPYMKVWMSADVPGGICAMSAGDRKTLAWQVIDYHAILAPADQ